MARRLAEEGAKVVLSDLHDAVLPATKDIAAAHPESAAAGVVTDVTDVQDCERSMSVAIETHGRLDVLAHAGIRVNASRQHTCRPG